MGQWVKASRDQWVSGSMGQEIKGSMDQGINGSMGQGVKGSRDQWVNGSRSQGIKGSRAPDPGSWIPDPGSSALGPGILHFPCVFIGFQEVQKSSETPRLSVGDRSRDLPHGIRPSGGAPLYQRPKGKQQHNGGSNTLRAKAQRIFGSSSS